MSISVFGYVVLLTLLLAAASAEYRGRRVRQNVEQPFTFELSRDK
jgi:hypothetical protein